MTGGRGEGAGQRSDARKLAFLVKYRNNKASTKLSNVFIVFLTVSLLKWHIIYCNTSNIKEDMNELRFFGGFY